MAESQGPESRPEPGRLTELEARVEDLAEDFLEQLQAGERPSRDAVVAAHPDVADRLEEQLALVEMLHWARLSNVAALGETAAGAAGDAGAADAADGSPAAEALLLPPIGRRAARGAGADMLELYPGDPPGLVGDDGRLHRPVQHLPPPRLPGSQGGSERPLFLPVPQRHLRP